MEKDTFNQLVKLLRQREIVDFDAMDSLDMIDFIQTVEKHFNVPIPDKMIIELNSLEDIVRAVDALKATN
jgi:acyl carrier protein